MDLTAVWDLVSQKLVLQAIVLYFVYVSGRQRHTIDELACLLSIDNSLESEIA